MNSNPAEVSSSLSKLTLIPPHVAIIMDGNGRWAQKRLLNRIKGHEKGAETVRSIVRTSREIGIRHLTLYAFSTENWQRPKYEVEALMRLLDHFLVTEQEELQSNHIRLDVIGQTDKLPEFVRKSLQRVMDATRTNEAMTLHLALSYGSRPEIIRMVRNIAQKAANAEIKPNDINEETIESHLYTSGIPDPDLLIRTSGEMRISNFLLWQIAYTEIFVTDTLWPDFTRQEFIDILLAYQKRDRRYGNVKS